MGEKLEQVARALVLFHKNKATTACACLGPEKPDDPGCRCEMTFAREDARTAIEDMREPTVAMVRAAWYDPGGGPLIEELSVGKGYYNIKNDTAYEVWQAMIDEALK